MDVGSELRAGVTFIFIRAKTCRGYLPHDLFDLFRLRLLLYGCLTRDQDLWFEKLKRRKVSRARLYFQMKGENRMNE